jgi:BMFP domain-containing protein YqiC
VAPKNTSDADITAANDLTEDESTQIGLATAEALAEEGAVAALTSVTEAQTKQAEIQTALDAYKALSDEAKDLLPEETRTQFEALEQILAEVTAKLAELEAANTFKTTHATVLSLTVNTVTSGDKTAVQAALAAYNALSAEVKALLSSEKAKLDVLLAKIADLEAAENASDADLAAAAAFRTAHATPLALTVNTVAIANKAAVQAAITAYGNLTDAVKALLTSEKTLLDNLLNKITQLETAASDTAANQQAATTFRTTHAAALGKTTTSVAIADKTAVQAALTAYGNLTQAVKALLTTEKTLLDNLLAKITQLEATPPAPGTITINPTTWQDGEIASSGGATTIAKASSGSFTATVSAGYTVSDGYTVAWYVNGVLVDGQTASTIVINAAAYDTGKHRLGVTAVKDGVPYATEISFTVTN